MVPHKTKRGAAALERMKCFEGIPTPYDRVKRLVVPAALKVLRLQHGHRYCVLGDLATEVRTLPWRLGLHGECCGPSVHVICTAGAGGPERVAHAEMRTCGNAHMRKCAHTHMRTRGPGGVY
jgi:hypothetical protein